MHSSPGKEPFAKEDLLSQMPAQHRRASERQIRRLWQSRSCCATSS